MWTDICQAFSSLVYRSSCRRGVAPQRLAALALAAAPLMVGAPGFYQTSAEDLALPLGQIIERVVCQHAPSQTYALYLPTTYSADRKWPILYVFEPGARGAEGVRLFRPAAERLGYIVAVSNNSHNGPSIISYTAMEAMWLDTHRRFSIDDRRVYTSGMSGGTQPATRLAIALGAGIIACAGPIQLPAVAKLDNKTFTWLGVAGDVDYNFDRNRDAVVDLSKRGVPARLVSFDGGHGWPPGDVLTRCMEWLELGAMRTARRPPDPAFIERMRQQGLARARDLIAQNRPFDAAEENENLAREFAGLAPVEAFEAEARRLRAMHDARRQEKQIEEIAAKCRSESARLTRLRLAFEESATLGPRTLGTINDLNEMVTDVENARQDLMQALMRLQRDGETAMDREARLVARRVLRGFISETYYSGQQYRRNGQFDKARVASELHEIMRPKSPLPAYEMARTAAARGDKKNALAELRRSIELGFSDLWRLADDEEWKDLADQPEIKAIIEELHSRRVR